MSEPVRLTADHVVYSFSPEHPSAVEVASGATLVIETRDAYDRQFQESLVVSRYLRERSSRPTNPPTADARWISYTEPGIAD